MFEEKVMFRAKGLSSKGASKEIHYDEGPSLKMLVSHLKHLGTSLILLASIILVWLMGGDFSYHWEVSQIGKNLTIILCVPT